MQMIPVSIMVKAGSATRKVNPLKKMQSVVAVACKILRVFYTILTKGVDYDAEKLVSDIRRPQLQGA